MLKTGLEFAPGTTDECKALVGRLFTPTDIFGRYRDARNLHRTGDLVMVTSESDPGGFNTRPRAAYIRELKAKGRIHPLAQALVDKSAHAIVQMPFTSDAMWFIVTRHQAIPVMCVIYATPYETTSAGTPESDMTVLN